jgi:hypothetical protein
MPMRRAALRMAAFGALAGALMLMGGPALASTGTGSQNPALTTTLTLINTGGGADGNPETAQLGETVTATASIKNNTAEDQPTVLVRVTAQDPAGASLTVPAKISLTANETLTLSVDFPTSADQFQLGVYTTTLSASFDGVWSSVADASITLV